MNRSLVIKYFDGLTTPEETVLMEVWLQSAENQRQMERWLWEDYVETSGVMPDEAAARLKSDLRRQIKPARVFSIGRVFAAAASIVVVVLAGFLFWHRQPAATAELAYVDSFVNNTSNSQKRILPDGSTVWLNAGARVFVADRYNDRERRIRLKGEGFFDIKHDPSRPFFAEAGGLITQVLGTSFTIEAYPGEAETRVSLVTGKVAVSAAANAGTKGANCMLSPGQMVTYTDRSGAIAVSAFTLDPAAWIHGKIILNKLSLPEALARLSRLYHSPIQYDPEQLKKMVITGEFDRDSLSEVLQSILFVHNLSFKAVSGGGYRIY